MAFRFSLEPVLRLRASYERLERLRLLAVGALIVRVRQEIAVVASETAEAERSKQARLATGVVAVDLHLESAVERGRAARREQLDRRLAALERAQENQRRAFHAARQKRQILENLRARRWEEYRRDQSRREQQQLDELHLIHRARRPPE
ncbi:MAG TPA: flagellar export protein FliJ [Candidatus Sulfotelmatobacter sp.]|nr:flagellar export protein FliJ [Candidatus Sulfotelmatobacter sp.]